MRRRTIAVAALAVAAATPAPASAATGSLYPGAGQRPGPALLYAKPFNAPQLQNVGPWRARPILVSGTTAYRGGEFLYQDFLYDDNGAQESADPNDPRTAGNLFSKQNGTYTYPTDPRYANNAADIVELRVKPLTQTTAFRLTLNTMKVPKLVAFSIAIGGVPGSPHPFPRGANVSAPAALFLTVHAQGAGFVGELTRAATGAKVGGGAPTVHVDKLRRQIEVRVPHSAWDPGRRVVRLAAGVGLWDAAANRYLLPQASADASHPGGAGSASNPAAFFNVAFRTNEPIQGPDEGVAVVTDAAWWRDRAQGNALGENGIGRFSANVDFAKLHSGARDDSAVPKRGPMDRILPSHFETAQGADFSQACFGAPSNCPGQYRGRLQPYAIYVPRKPRPAGGYGMTLLLHSLSAQYNQYLGTRNQSQLGERGPGSIVITPEARGPDEDYENYGAADVFDVWADVARHYKLDPPWSTISGYSMGAIGTFKLGAQFPDLFARAQSTVGYESNEDVLASLRNVPVLMWNNRGDELVNDAFYTATADALDALDYRYELDAFQPCANPGCSPVFSNHLQLAINDQYAPAAAFLGTARVDRSPAHVTYVMEPERNHANLRVVGDHAYWVTKLKLRDKGSQGKIDAISHGVGLGDPVASATQPGTGTLPGGRFGTLLFTSQRKTWGPAPSRPRANRIDIEATNIRRATIDFRRARVGCDAKVNVVSDGPITVVMRECGRVISAG